MDPETDLGPLPKSDRNRELQALSLEAFRGILPVHNFVVRDERIEDAGVDASLELLLQGYFTNMRAQVQLKSTDSEELNSDGSFSLQVNTSNLNYLLNGQSPLYVLYIVPRKELRFAWARDERKRLDQNNPTWLQQGSITIVFRQVLSVEALEQIHLRIRQEAQLQRHIHDVLGRAVTSEFVVLGINPENLSSIDSDQTLQILLKGGLTLVSSGIAAEVINLIDLLPPNSRRLTRIRLIRAYAEYNTGDYQSALASVGKVLLSREELSTDDNQFIAHLKVACEFALGHITAKEYISLQESQISQAKGVFALNHRLIYLKQSLSKAESNEDRAVLLEDLWRFSQSVAHAHDVSDAFKLQTEIALLYEEGRQFIQESLSRMSELKMRKKMGYYVDADFESAVSTDVSLWLAWIQRVDSALEHAKSQDNPQLIGEALLTWLKIHTARLMNRRFLANMATLPELTMTALANFQDIAEQTMQIYRAADNLEGEIRAQLMLVDIFMLFDKDDKAKEIAQEVLPKTQAMNYVYLENWATEIISASSFWHQARSFFKRMEEQDEDFTMAAHTDAEMGDFARSSMRAMRLPDKRLPVVTREAMSLREIARERLYWCQHIELTQDLRHTAHPSTMYLFDPDRFGWCRKYNYKSAIGNPDWALVINAFKRTYCQNCTSRLPKDKIPSENH